MRKIGVLILIYFILGAVSIYAEDFPVSEEAKRLPETTRVLINFSGIRPLKYSHRLELEPPRIIVKFSSRDVFAEMEDTVEVNRGVVKKIYVKRHKRGSRRVGKKKQYPIKSLTFELLQETGYEIKIEGNTLFIDIQNPPGLTEEELPLGKIEITETIKTEEELQQREKALGNALFKAKQKLKGADIEVKEPAIEMPIAVEEKEITKPTEQRRIENKKKVTPIKPSQTTRKFSPIKSLIYFLGLIAVFILGLFYEKRKKLEIDQEEIDKKINEMRNLETAKRSFLTRELEEIKAKFLEKEKLLNVATSKCQEFKKEIEQKQEALKALEKEKASQEEKLEELKRKAESAEVNLSEKERKLEEQFNTCNLLEDTLAEKEKAIDKLMEKEQDLNLEISAKEQLLKNTAEKYQRLLDTTDKKIKGEIGLRHVLEKELAEKEKLIDELLKKQEIKEKEITKEEPRYLDLTSLGDKGVLVQISRAKGMAPLVRPVKKIGPEGIIFDTDKRLNVIKLFRIRLFFFGSTSPIDVMAKIIEQKYDKRTSKYELKTIFLLLSDKDKRKLNHYIEEKNKELNINLTN